MAETTYGYNITVEPHKVKISCIFFGESKNGDIFFLPQHLGCRVGMKNLVPYQVLLSFVLYCTNSRTKSLISSINSSA